MLKNILNYGGMNNCLPQRNHLYNFGITCFHLEKGCHTTCGVYLWYFLHYLQWYFCMPFLIPFLMYWLRRFGIYTP